MASENFLAGRGGEGADVVPVGQVLGQNVVGVDLVLQLLVGVLQIGLFLVFLEGVEERGGGAGGEEGAHDEDVVFVVDLLVHQVDFQGHVRVVNRVFGVVEVELQELVLDPADRHLEVTVLGDDDLPRPLLELEPGIALEPGKGHGAVGLFDGQKLAGLPDGLEVDGAGGGGRERGRKGRKDEWSVAMQGRQG